MNFSQLVMQSHREECLEALQRRSTAPDALDILLNVGVVTDDINGMNIRRNKTKLARFIKPMTTRQAREIRGFVYRLEQQH